PCRASPKRARQRSYACRWRRRGRTCRPSSRARWRCVRCRRLSERLRFGRVTRSLGSCRSWVLADPRVLAVLRLEVDRDRVLRGVRMLAAAIDTKLRQLLARQRAFLRHHALDGLFKDALRMLAGENLARDALLDPARVTGVAIVDLVGHFLAGERNLVGVDDDDMVARINVRREVGAMLAAKAKRDERSEAADHNALGIHNDPAVGDFRSLGRARRKGAHWVVPDKNEGARLLQRRIGVNSLHFSY